MSQAVEEMNSGSPLAKIVGGTPAITAKLAGVEVECLLDTGSMVTLVSEAFFKQKLESVCGGVKGGSQMLTLRGANGLEIPYLGYLELDVCVEGVTIPKCGVLVLKDTAATGPQRRRKPGVLGTNVLAQIPKFAELLKLKGSAGASSTQNQKPSKQGLVKVAGSRAVWIPPHSAMNVDVTGPACGANAVVEPLRTPLKGGLQVATTLLRSPADQPYQSRGQPDAQNLPWFGPVSRSDYERAVGIYRGEQRGSGVFWTRCRLPGGILTDP